MGNDQQSSWWAGTVRIGRLIGVYVLGVLTPILTSFGTRIVDNMSRSWLAPDVEVRISSILIGVDQGDSAVSVHLRMTVLNDDLYDHSVTPIYLKNTMTGDSLAVEPAPSIVSPAHAPKVDSLLFYERCVPNALKVFPSRELQGWTLGYRIDAKKQVQQSNAAPTELRRIHFVFLLNDAIDFPKKAASQKVDIKQMIYFTDTSSDAPQKGRVEVNSYYYPKDWIAIGTKDMLGNVHVIEPAEMFSDGEEFGTSGTIYEAYFDKRYLSHADAGFILAWPVGFQNSSTIAELTRTSGSLKEIYSLFGTYVDPSIMSYPYFLYVSY